MLPGTSRLKRFSPLIPGKQFEGYHPGITPPTCRQFLHGADRPLSCRSRHPSARYVDDMYIFLPSVDAAGLLMRRLIPELRAYDLVLNEAKSVIMPKSALNTEEPDLEALFDEAVQEISSQIEEEDFDADYGFQSEWEDEDEEPADQLEDNGGEPREDFELEATMVLFDAITDHPGHEETIERFCLPLFAKAESDYGGARPRRFRETTVDDADLCFLSFQVPTRPAGL